MPAGRTGAAALVIGLLVSGCSQDPQPRIETAPSTPATSSTPPPIVAEPETPAAFIQRWFDVGVAMQATGDLRPFEALNRSCDPCDDLVETVRNYYTRGGFIRPSPVQVVAVSGSASTENEFKVRTTSGTTIVKESQQGETKKLKGGPETYTVRLSRAGDTWKMQAYLLELS